LRLPLARRHGRMLRRNLVYTAITRAKHLVVLVVESGALDLAIEAAPSRAAGPSPTSPWSMRSLGIRLRPKKGGAESHGPMDQPKKELTSQRLSFG
jgi:hypothetical protein